MNLSEGDIIWCIADSDESERYNHSLSKGLRQPRKMKVTQTYPLRVAHYGPDGEPNLDENARATFRSADPEEHLFEDRKEAWTKYIEERRSRLNDKVRRLQDQLLRLDRVNQALELDWNQEGLEFLLEHNKPLSYVANVTDNDYDY